MKTTKIIKKIGLISAFSIFHLAISSCDGESSSSGSSSSSSSGGNNDNNQNENALRTRTFNIAIISTDRDHRQKRLKAYVTNIDFDPGQYLDFLISAEYYDLGSFGTNIFLNLNDNQIERAKSWNFGTWNESQPFQFTVNQTSSMSSGVHFFAELSIGTSFNPTQSVVIESGFDIEIDGIRYPWIPTGEFLRSTGGFRLRLTWDINLKRFVLTQSNSNSGNKILATWE